MPFRRAPNLDTHKKILGEKVIRRENFSQHVDSQVTKTEIEFSLSSYHFFCFFIFYFIKIVILQREENDENDDDREKNATFFRFGFKLYKNIIQKCDNLCSQLLSLGALVSWMQGKQPLGT